MTKQDSHKVYYKSGDEYKEVKKDKDNLAVDETGTSIPVDQLYLKADISGKSIFITVKDHILSGGNVEGLNITKKDLTSLIAQKAATIDLDKDGKTNEGEGKPFSEKVMATAATQMAVFQNYGKRDAYTSAEASNVLNKMDKELPGSISELDVIANPMLKSAKWIGEGQEEGIKKDTLNRN